MSGQGYVLDIDTQFLNRLKQADEELKKIIGSVDNVTGAFKNMLNTAGGINNNIFSNIINQVEKLGKTRITANVDLSQLEKMMSTLTEISTVMGTMSKGGKELFDLNGVGNMNASLVETENQLKVVEKRISELKKEYNEAGFKDPINPTTGKPYGRETKTYKDARAAYMSSPESQSIRDEKDALLRAEIEKKAILDRELKFAKMTQDEKASYIQKKVAEILNAEKKTAEEIQKEYSTTISKMVKIGGQYDKSSKKNTDGSLDPQLEKMKAQFDDLNKRRMELERNYGAYVVNVATEANAKIANLEIKRILDRQAAEKQAIIDTRNTPIGALNAATYASTVTEMREAMKHLQTARDNTNVNDKATIDQLNESYIRLRATVESLTVAEKNENSLQPSIRSEYERLHRELDKVRESKKQLADLQATSQTAKNKASLEARENDLVNRIAEIKTAAKDKLDAADRKIAADRAARDIERTIQTEAQKKAEIIKQYQEALKAKEELDRIHNKMTKESLASGGRTPNQADKDEIARQRAEVAQKIEGIERNHSEAIKGIVDKRNRDRIKADLDAGKQQIALNTRQQAQLRRIVQQAQKGGAWDTFKDSINPFKRGKQVDTKSIEEAVAAIDRLKAARERLNKANMNDSNGRYQRAINRVNEEIKKQEAYVDRLRGAHRRLSETASQLRSILSRVFGFYALKNYASQLIRVRGEFEMAQKSLEVLLRNKGEADLLWQRTVDLAVKSPYTTQQLVTATKQLAAYRVESHKLYSTTKMLTDISSGLGVEINRLVLAYGQVKAANFLRGTELRQFSEAGVNLLDELAQHFTNIEGKTVTVQQVFDRISKRMVAFKDVEAVLQKITSSGGVFYNMQEQQSETLKGQVLNLKDSVELMFNDMGKAADGTIKGIVSMLKWLVEHWRLVGAVMGPILTAFLSFKVVIGIINGLRLAMLKLNRAMNSNPILFWAGVVASVASTVLALCSSVGALSDELVNQIDVFNDNVTNINGYSNAVITLTNQITELEKIDKKNIEQERELARVTAARASALNELIGLNKEYGLSMSAAGNDVEKMKVLQQEETERQKTTRNFLVHLSEVDIEGLDKANASLAAVQAKLAALANMELPRAKDSLVKAIKESNGDVEKFKALYEKYLIEIDRYRESAAKSTAKNALNFSYDLGNDEAEKMWNDIGNLYASSLESSDIENSLRDAVAKSFNASQIDGIKQGLANGEDSEEYKNSIRLLRAQYFHIVKQAAEELGPNGAVIVEEEFATLFGLMEDWLYKTEPIAMEDWMVSYNKALKTFVDENSALYGILTATEQDTVNKRISAIKQEIAEKEALIAANLALIATSTDANEKASLQASIDEDKKVVESGTKALAILGSKGSGGSGQDKWEKSVKTIKDVYDAYSKLSAKFDQTTATTKLWKQWGKVVDENLKSIGFSATKVKGKFGDLNTEESIKSALDYLSENGSKKGKKAALELKAEIELDYEIKEQDKKRDELKREVERMFTGYELSLEIAELNIPQDFASKFFDMDVLDINELRKKLFEKKGDFVAQGDEGVEAYNDFLDKLDEMEAKSQQDRLKKYLEFTKKAYSEQGQILVETSAKIMDINSTFKLTNSMAFSEGIISEDQLSKIKEAGNDISTMTEAELRQLNLTDTQIEKWRQLTELLKTQKKLATDKAEEEKNKKVQEASWKSFKETEIFAEVFNDLENASDSLMEVTLTRLKEFKAAWAGMDMKEFSEVLKMIDKLESQLAMSTPKETRRETRTALKNAMQRTGEYAITFRSKKAQELFSEIKGVTTMKDYDKYNEALQVELAHREGLLSTAKATLATTEAEYNATMQNAKATEDEKKQAKIKLGTAQKAVETAEKNRNTVAKTLSLDKMRRKALEETNKNMSYALEQANKIYNAIKGLVDVLGGGDSIAMIFVDMGMQMLETVMNTIMLQMQLKAATVAAYELSAAMKSIAGPLGWAVMAVELLAIGLNAIFSSKEKNRQDKIDAKTKEIQKLQKEYERLSNSIDNVFSSSELNSTISEMNANLQDQISKTEDLLAAEQDAKNPDQDKIDEYNEQLLDLMEQQAELVRQKFSIATDGVLDSTLDATRGFVDAWYDAFKETGDGISGLHDNFNDMFASILKQQASLTLVGPMVDDFKDRVEAYMNNDGVLGEYEARELRKIWDEKSGKINESLKSYFDVFDDILTVDYGELSGLEKGIQGMTEDQAEVLASYWNSCRFILSNIDTTLTRMADRILGGGSQSNSTELAIREQTQVIEEIRDLLSEVIGYGGTSTHSRSYLRVNDA